jgi:hypothetical protein
LQTVSDYTRNEGTREGADNEASQISGGMIMQKLTTPNAILFGLGLIALAIASVPYSSSLVKTAHANQLPISKDGFLKVQLCGTSIDYRTFSTKKGCANVSSVGQVSVFQTSKDGYYKK